MFLAIISYVLGIAMEAAIPKSGIIGRYLNPVSGFSILLFLLNAISTLLTFVIFSQQHPFNKKENAFIVIMSSAAANSALGTEVLAVQRLYYNITPNPGASILWV